MKNDMAVKFYRYKYNDKLVNPTPFAMRVVERVIENLSFPIVLEKFQETEERIMEILKEEYIKADARSLDVSEICLINGEEFNEEEWDVEIDFCKIRISHDWARNERMPHECRVTDEIVIEPINQDVATLSWKLERLENKLMGKKVPYLVKLISYDRDYEENLMLEFLEKNKDICDYERAKSYDIRRDCPCCTHKFVTENLPVMLNYIRTKVFPRIRELQATQIRDGKVINLLDKPDSILLQTSVYERRIDIYTILRSFVYFGAERI